MKAEIALADLGFTDFESLLYCELLRQGPQTGYRLSQIVSKAPANTYSALKTLTEKGAALVSNNAGETKTYGAVPPEELLAGVSKAFERRRNSALQCLRSLKTPISEERVYQFQTVAQVVERAHAMLARAKEIVLFDFFPPVFEMMKKSISCAESRGVTIAGMAYKREHSSELIPHNIDAEDAINDLWPGLGLIVVSDGSEMLIAQISQDRRALLNGIWSDSAFLSATYHSALAAEIRLVALQKDASDPLKHISLFRSKPPGLRMVQEREERKYV